MGKTVEESLPRNPQEAAQIPEPEWPRVPGRPGPQVNRVVVVATRSEPGLVAPLKVIP